MLLSAIARWLAPNSHDVQGPQDIKQIICNSDFSDKEKKKALNLLDRKALASTASKRWMIVVIVFDLFIFISSVCFMIAGKFHLTAEEIMSALCWIIGITAIFVGIYFISDKQYEHEIMKYIDLPADEHIEKPKDTTASNRDDENEVVRIKAKITQDSEVIKYVCDSCESEVKYGMKYCPECGNKLDWPE